jgi:hypothetical protein
MVRQPSDLTPIHNMARRLVREVCCQTKFIYGGELILGFGETRRYSYPGRLAGRSYAEWELSPVASDWQLFAAHGSELTNNNAAVGEAQKRLRLLIGSRVVDVRINMPILDLEIEMGNGVRFRIACVEDEEEWSFPDSEEDSYDHYGAEPVELPCWELATPDDLELQVMTGGRWAFVEDLRDLRRWQSRPSKAAVRASGGYPIRRQQPGITPHALADRLVGLPCSDARSTDEGRLLLEFGTTWEVSPAGAGWSIHGPDGSEVWRGDADTGDSLRRLREIVGRTVESATVTMPGLAFEIVFDNGDSVRMVCPSGDGPEQPPDESERSYERLCWEIQTPHWMKLQALTNGRWEIAAGIPASER